MTTNIEPIPQQSSIREFAEAVKVLCNDFSSITGSVYIQDVKSAIDGLLEQHLAAPTPPIESYNKVKSNL